MRKIINLIFIILLIVLVGCKKDSKIEGNVVADMKDYNFIPVVEGMLNGKKAYFVLDTGASVSVLDINRSSKYNFSVLGENESGITGYGGTDSSVMELDNYIISVGGVSMKDVVIGKDIKTLLAAVRAHTGYDVVGILGNNFISQNNLVIDFKNGLIYKYD